MASKSGTLIIRAVLIHQVQVKYLAQEVRNFRRDHIWSCTLKCGCYQVSKCDTLIARTTSGKTSCTGSQELPTRPYLGMYIHRHVAVTGYLNLVH